MTKDEIARHLESVISGVTVINSMQAEHCGAYYFHIHTPTMEEVKKVCDFTQKFKMPYPIVYFVDEKPILIITLASWQATTIFW